MDKTISRKAARRAAMQLIYERMYGGEGGEYSFLEMILNIEPEDVKKELENDDLEGQSVAQASENNSPSTEYSFALVEGTFSNISAIDEIISAYSPKRKTDRMPGLVLAVLRLALYELLFEKNTPQSVVINEAVDMAKRFGNLTDAKFVNGLLGKYCKENNLTYESDNRD